MCPKSHNKLSDKVRTQTQAADPTAQAPQLLSRSLHVSFPAAGPSPPTLEVKPQCCSLTFVFPYGTSLQSFVCIQIVQRYSISSPSLFQKVSLKLWILNFSRKCCTIVTKQLWLSPGIDLFILLQWEISWRQEFSGKGFLSFSLSLYI